MKKLIIGLLITLVSFNLFALNKESIYGSDALEIVQALTTLNVSGTPNGNDDAGYVNIKVYDFLGMECVTADSHYGGYGSKLEGACHFSGIKDVGQLNKIKTILKAAGLNPKNSIFKTEKK